jgi:hypothetical protein
MRPVATIMLLACLLLGTGAVPAAAKSITIPITWSVSKGELSIARLRASVGPKIRTYVCTTYRKSQHPGNVLKSGGNVKVVFYGFGRDILTSFTFSKRDCG